MSAYKKTKTAKIKKNCKILLSCEALEHNNKNNTFQNNTTTKITNKQAPVAAHDCDFLRDKCEPVNIAATVTPKIDNNKAKSDSEHAVTQKQYTMRTRLSVGTEEDLEKEVETSLPRRKKLI